jgi:acetoin utilization deacetylase AcuC-like enzyme
MLTIYSDQHADHHGAVELAEGQMRPAVEIPARAHTILDRVREMNLGPVRPPVEHGLAPLERVHTRPYLAFLEEAWDLWHAEHGACDAFPIQWLVRGMRQVEPARIDGRIGYYAGDAGSPITAGTWRASRAAADVALTGMDAILDGQRSTFALCRPPGHHASQDVFSGYCFLNNAAITAQAARDRGIGKVAILDIDYHHGNGTQNIFYDRGDVLFVSIHADPADEYPYYLGYADERGAGEGEGQNLNLPMPAGTTFARYREALTQAVGAIAEFGAELLVVSLGADTYKDDPISRFRLESDDFSRIGEDLAGAGLPTLFVMEGGYAVSALGRNVVNVLTGFEGAQR